MSRLVLAFKAFFSLLFRGTLADAVALELNLVRRGAAPPTPAAARTSEPAKAVAAPADGAVQLLAALQREARLVDFLLEDIGPYSDDQVGAAVRDVHKHSRAVLDRYLRLTPVIDGVEGAVTKLASLGADARDASVVRLIGNVPADGKADAGILRHRGWKAEKVDFPAPRPGDRIIAPAEIEVE